MTVATYEWELLPDQIIAPAQPTERLWRYSNGAIGIPMQVWLDMGKPTAFLRYVDHKHRAVRFLPDRVGVEQSVSLNTNRRVSIQPVIRAWGLPTEGVARLVSWDAEQVTYQFMEGDGNGSNPA